MSQSPHDPHGSQGHTVRYSPHHSLLAQSTSKASNANVYGLIAMHPSPSCLCWKSQSVAKASGDCHDIAPLPKQRAARRLLEVQHGAAFTGYAASPISNVLAGRSWLGSLQASTSKVRETQKKQSPHFANEPGRVLAGIAGPGRKEPYCEIVLRMERRTRACC